MLYVTSRIDINQPVEKVFAFVVDVRRVREWQSDLIDAYVTPEGPVQAGTVYHYISEVLGQRRYSRMQVTMIDENRRLLLTSPSRISAVETAYHFEPVNGGTRLTMTTHVEGTFVPMAREMIERHTRDLLQARLERIRQLLEGTS
ncbi:MAG: SRPBCC family protein [Anaerolineae bacterium]|nr:SRPBCC family protein [Anaerolineae bacterium]